MGSIWEAVGFTRFPLGICFLVVVVLAFWSALKLFRPGALPDGKVKALVDGVLTWGFLALIVGVAGMFVGTILAFQGYAATAQFYSPPVATGVRVGVLSASLATIVLGLAVLLWWVLQLRWRFLKAGLEEEP
jgi:hypothetical protein